MEHMLATRLTPILNVSDIQESFAWFEKLGWKKGWDWASPPTFGGVCSGASVISGPSHHEFLARYRLLWLAFFASSKGPILAPRVPS
jgi:hypothetical protein